MEATGVVRKIDELGRIVIPKEIRKSLGIKDGASLAIYTDKDIVALKKCSPLGNLVEVSNAFSETVYNVTKKEMFITDKDAIVSAPITRKKMFQNKKISKYLEECIKNKDIVVEKNIKKIYLTDEKTIECSYIIAPIIANNEILGLIILVSDKKINDNDLNLVNIASEFFGKNVEE